jgi:hypothetical protein
MTTVWNGPLPIWLTLLLGAALVIALIHGTWTLLRKQVAPRWIAVLGALRVAILGVFVLILLQPIVTYSANVPQLPEMAVLVDVSTSMGQPSGSGDGTRLQEAAARLRTGPLADALTSRYRLHWFAFDRTTVPLESADLTALKPTANSAQYATSIDATAKHLRAIGRNPQRLLLVSDGNDRGEDDPVEAARRFGMLVDVLPSTGQPDGAATNLEIIEVQGARRVLLGSETIFRVTLSGKRALGNDRNFLLRVMEDGKKVLEYPGVLPAQRLELTLQLTHRPGAAGLKHYEFHLSSGDGLARKPFPMALQVLDSKYEVLILEDRWRWEYKYLHRLFEDDPSFRFTALLARGGGAFVQFGSPDRRVNLIGLPQSRADVESFDTFVLGDVNPALWPRGLAADLARQVTDSGRSLVVIAGPGLANLREIPELHAILPVELTAESGKPVEGPIDVRLRDDASDSPFFFQLRAGAGDKLPPLDQIYPVVRKRPGATVLLEAAKARNDYGNLIVIAEQTVGRGRVLFVGSDTLWKWHTLAASNEGPTPYSIFWQQAFRAMTPARSNVGGVNLWLTPSRSRAEVGRAITVEAEVQSARALPGVNVDAAVTAPDGQRLPLVLSADAGNPRMFRTTFRCQQAGVHRIWASAHAEGKAVAEGAAVVQIDPPGSDSGDVDLANLARIAQATGGQVIDPDRPETWPAPSGELPSVEQTRTLDLWNNFTLLLVLCALLGADWFIRLFQGLVSG